MSRTYAPRAPASEVERVPDDRLFTQRITLDNQYAMSLIPELAETS